MAVTTPPLATQHFWLTCWVGRALALPLSLVWTFKYPSHSPDANLRQVLDESASVATHIWVWGGVPSLFFGWLRLSIMRRLFAAYQSQPGAEYLAWVVLGALASFEVLVLLASVALHLSWKIGMGFWFDWEVCAGHTLPWLLATGWAGWWVPRRAARSAK